MSLESGKNYLLEEGLKDPNWATLLFMNVIGMLVSLLLMGGVAMSTLGQRDVGTREKVESPQKV